MNRRARQSSPIGLALLAFLAASCRTDRTRPFVVSSYPVQGATGIATTVTPRFTFSELMDQASVESAFAMSGGVYGQFAWDNQTATFVPSPDLDPQTTYTMSISTQARDLAGNPLDSAAAVTFATGDSASPGLVNVRMMGRSVMAGWFNHWGADPYARNRFVLYYNPVQPPPDIVASVQAIVDSITVCDEPVIFFKLCFVDFEGGDSVTAQANLDRNLGYVGQVYTIVNNRGLKLILGNALPQVAATTDPWLVWNHERYNQGLLDFVTQHGAVRAFDLYSVLTDSLTGALKPQYALSSSDSHLNDAGYTALDTPFFAFLEQYY